MSNKIKTFTINKNSTLVDSGYHEKDIRAVIEKDGQELECLGWIQTKDPSESLWTIKDILNFPYTENTSFKAFFGDFPYKIYFDATNGGKYTNSYPSNIISEELSSLKEGLINFPTPSMSGYQFKNWYLSSEEADNNLMDQIKSQSTSAIAHANWNFNGEDKYAVTFTLDYKDDPETLEVIEKCCIDENNIYFKIDADNVLIINSSNLNTDIIINRTESDDYEWTYFIRSDNILNYMENTLSFPISIPAVLSIDIERTDSHESFDISGDNEDILTYTFVSACTVKISFKLSDQISPIEDNFEFDWVSGEENMDLVRPIGPYSPMLIPASSIEGIDLQGQTTDTFWIKNFSISEALVAYDETYYAAPAGNKEINQVRLPGEVNFICFGSPSRGADRYYLSKDANYKTILFIATKAEYSNSLYCDKEIYWEGDADSFQDLLTKSFYISNRFFCEDNNGTITTVDFSMRSFTLTLSSVYVNAVAIQRPKAGVVFLNNSTEDPMEEDWDNYTFTYTSSNQKWTFSQN